MKKGIIVLLIAVLVAGFAFADGKLTAGTLKGDATIKFGINLDDKAFGFENSTTVKYNFKFEFDTTKVEVGEHQTELWAEIAATASASVSIKDSAEIKHNQEAKITKANIHVGEWTFGILNAGTAVNYAKSYYKNDDGSAVNDLVKGGSKEVAGFTVAYQDWKGGFGLKGNWANDEFFINVFAHGETKAFKFGANEEFSAQAGGYVHYYRGELVGAEPKNAGGAVKVAYAADKFSADAAADLRINRVAGENKFLFEAAANATYTINENGKAGLNVYATNALGEDIKLDAKAWANYNFDFDGTKLETTAYVDVRDILTDERTFEVKATEKLTLDKLVLEFSEKYGYMQVTVLDPYAIEAYAFKFTAKATYTAEKFKATAAIDDLTFGKLTVGDESLTAMVLKASCGISSTAIIENAEIGATYKGFGFYKIFASGLDDSSEITKGAIEAYAKITF
jgi:hypothetical protein